MKRYGCCVFSLAVLLAAAGCGSRGYADGVYSGRSGPDDTGAWGEVTLTIAGERVANCRFVTRQKDGTVKDENYGTVNGKISNRDYYDKAQLAVRAMARYAEAFRETGDLRKVEAVSGATIAFDQFTEAVERALETAKKSR
ncbi:MAG: FMN-binding protein [Treponema sp.]|jgi:major membrane immunogen (membrane-anchored lipoprotein)|nr:FMN-binding protein [Treponema sp.]